MRNEEKIDAFLDKVLAEYSSATPRVGLEGRILASLKEERPQRKWLWAWIAVPAVTAILLFALLWRPAPNKREVARNTPPKVIVAQPPRLVEPSPTEPAKPAHRVQQKQPKRVAPKAPDQQPRLATFPSRDHNDELVRVALRFAESHPAVASEIAAEQKEFSQMAAAFTEPLTGNEK